MNRAAGNWLFSLWRQDMARIRLIMLEHEGVRHEPDVVTLVFCRFSDFTDNALSSALFAARQPKPYYHRSRLLRQFCFTALLPDVTVIEPGAWCRAAGLAFDSFAGDEPGHLTETLLSGPAAPDWDYRATRRAAFTP